MMNRFFALPIFAAALVLSANFVQADASIISEKAHCHHHHDDNFISTNFSLTSVDDIGYIFTVSPVSGEGFSIDSSGTITFPHSGSYLIEFTLAFSSDPTTQTNQFNILWNGIGAFQLFDSSESIQVGTVIDFNGTTLVTARGPVTIQTLYQNLGSISTLVPLNGFLTVTKLNLSHS